MGVQVRMKSRKMSRDYRGIQYLLSYQFLVFPQACSAVADVCWTPRWHTSEGRRTWPGGDLAVTAWFWTISGNWRSSVYCKRSACTTSKSLKWFRHLTRVASVTVKIELSARTTDFLCTTVLCRWRRPDITCCWGRSWRPPCRQDRMLSTRAATSATLPRALSWATVQAAALPPTAPTRGRGSWLPRCLSTPEALGTLGELTCVLKQNVFACLLSSVCVCWCTPSTGSTARWAAVPVRARWAPA